MKEELLKGLTEEQIAKLKTCKNAEEILTAAKAEGIELTDEQLEAVSGGCGPRVVACPKCGNTEKVRITHQYSGDSYWCRNCDFNWDYRYYL